MLSVLLIFALLIIYLIYSHFKKIEHMSKSCKIEHPICDNYCQRAKLDLCVHLVKDRR